MDGDVHGALVGELVGVWLGLLLGGCRLRGCRLLRLAVSAAAAAFADAVEAVAAGAAARPRRAVALLRRVGGVRRRRGLPPPQLWRLGPRRRQLLVFSLGRRSLVVEAWHWCGLERQALPQQLQCFLLFFLQVQIVKNYYRSASEKLFSLRLCSLDCW